jgi:GNAT superfamily N-acetyltransferase
MPEGLPEGITIRPMTSDDAAPAADVIVRGGWGDRREFFGWAVGHDGALPVVAVAEGTIVGTGVGSVHGRAGWVGAIFVDAAHRSRGLGAALTRWVIEDLETHGCTTLVLMATDLGRPIYEKLGFRVQTHYHMLATTGLPRVGGDDDGIRVFQSADLPAIVELDRRVTGEDRAAVLASFVERGSAIVATDAANRVAGFLVRPPWGGGAMVAPDPRDALRLLAWRRRAAGPEGRVGAGLPTENEVGRTILAEQGWQEVARPVRMVRGAAPEWDPTALWGQLGGPLG